MDCNDSLHRFTTWQVDLVASNSATNPAPASDRIVTWRLSENNKTSPVVHAAQQSAFYLNLQFIYTKEKVVGIFLIIMPILN